MARVTIGSSEAPQRFVEIQSRVGNIARGASAGSFSRQRSQQSSKRRGQRLGKAATSPARPRQHGGAACPTASRRANACRPVSIS